MTQTILFERTYELAANETEDEALAKGLNHSTFGKFYEALEEENVIDAEGNALVCYSMQVNVIDTPDGLRIRWRANKERDPNA